MAEISFNENREENRKKKVHRNRLDLLKYIQNPCEILRRYTNQLLPVYIKWHNVQNGKQ